MDPLSPTALFGELPLLRLRLKVQFADGARLPDYPGFAWRGLLGWELQRLLCPFTRRPACDTCIVHESCPAWLLLEARTPLPGLRESPRGCIFYAPPNTNDTGGELQLTLVGSCTRFVAVLSAALHEGQTAGLGVARVPYRTLSWEHLCPDSQAQPLSPEGTHKGLTPEGAPLSAWLAAAATDGALATAHLASPVRLRRNGKYLAAMDWPCFFATLARRLEALHCLYHGGASIGRERWLDLQKQFAAFAPPTTDLHWDDWTRYSSRQKKRVPMGGLTGSVSLADCPLGCSPGGGPRRWCMWARGRAWGWGGWH